MSFPADCGNGIIEFDEFCDDGYIDECGSCNATCDQAGTVSVCGDGTECPETETCDDGFADDCGRCNATCDGPGTGPGVCGDGVGCLSEGEVCDDGPLNGCGACNNDCTDYEAGLEVCGDGIACAGLGEICDDGFLDVCGTCNGDCTGPGDGATCGDGVVCPELEGCDDGNDVDFDGCCSCSICPFRLDLTPSRVKAIGVKLLVGGGFRAVWSITDDNNKSVLSRRFDAAAQPSGATTVLASGDPGIDWTNTAAIALAPDDTFVVAWDIGFPAGDQDVMVSRFADGAATSATTIVNTTVAGRQGDPQIAMQADGGYMIVWWGGALSDAGRISARLYSSSGAPVTGELAVNEYSWSVQSGPSVSSDGANRFVVVWRSSVSDGAPGSDHTDVRARLYDGSGVALSGELTLVDNSATGWSVAAPKVRMMAGGGFRVAWLQIFGDSFGVGSELRSQAFLTGGSAAGPFVTLRVLSPDDYGYPAHIASDGSITVTLAKLYDLSDLRIARYGASGAVQLPPSPARSGAVVGRPQGTSLDIAENGSVLVVWNESYYEGNVLKSACFAQWLAPDGTWLGPNGIVR